MIEQLFGSKTRVKLLKMFMSNPNRSFYVREITRKIEEQINSVRRELSNLLDIGIITSDSSNNRLYYEVDQSYEHYEALTSLFGDEEAKKAIGANKPVATKKTKAKALKKTPKAEESDLEVEPGMPDVDVLLLTGVFTRDEGAPADMLIVNSNDDNALKEYIADQEKAIGVEIRYAVLSEDDFEYRKRIKDRFLTNMLASRLTIKIDKKGLISK